MRGAELAERLQLPIEGLHLEDQFWIWLTAAEPHVRLSSRTYLYADRWLAGYDTVRVGEITLEVRHCPGDTLRHIIFLHRASRLAWVGDVLFNG